jgi:hypothetical protein
MAPFVTGSYSGLFTGPTSTSPGSSSGSAGPGTPGGGQAAGGAHLTVYSLHDLPDELKPLGTLLTLEAIWQQVSDPVDVRRRLVVVDEAWLLMRDPAGARFLFRMAKAARKHWAGLAVITQDAADVLATDLGQAIVANAATQILLRQAPQAIDAITDSFDLSDGERDLLLTTPKGTGLLLAGGTHRVAFTTVASHTEHMLAISGSELFRTSGSGAANSAADAPIRYEAHDPGPAQFLDPDPEADADSHAAYGFDPDSDPVDDFDSDAALEGEVYHP